MPKNKTERGKILSRVGSLIDDVVFQLAPVAGAQRKKNRLRTNLIEQQISKLSGGGHPAMSPNVTRDHRYIGNRQTADEQLEYSLYDMQWRARELYQVSPHAHGAVEGRVTHEIGVGLSCRPKIKENELLTKEQADEINDALKDVCKRWSAHGVDRRRRESLGAMQRLVERTYAIFGEAFVAFRQAPGKGPIGLTVELIHPMRVETPPEQSMDENVRMGIRYNAKTDQIIGYYVRVKGKKYDRHPPKYEFIRRYDRAGNEQIVHVFEAMLPEQSRGIPWLCAAFALLKDLDDFHEAELIAKQIEACFGLIIKSGSASASPASIAEGNSSGDTDSEGRRLEDIYPGMVHYSDSDEEITKIDPSRPGSTFAPFIEAGLRAIASSLNFPYELLAKNFFRTTYSSGRLAMLDGQLGFKLRRQPMIEQFLQPMWRRVVSDAFFFGWIDGIASRLQYVSAPYLFEDHSWGGQSFGAVDPNKEVNAHADAINTNQETLAEVHAENNNDWTDVLVQRDREIRKEIELRIEREKMEMELREAAGLPQPGEQDQDQGDGDPVNKTEDADDPGKNKKGGKR